VSGNVSARSSTLIIPSASDLTKSCRHDNFFKSQMQDFNIDRLFTEQENKLLLNPTTEFGGDYIIWTQGGHLLITSDYSPLYDALLGLELDKVKCCLKDGLDLNQRSLIDGRTPMFLFGIGSNLRSEQYNFLISRITDFLKNFSIDLTIKDIYGQTALDYALQHVTTAHSTRRLVECLISLGGKVNYNTMLTLFERFSNCTRFFNWLPYDELTMEDKFWLAIRTASSIARRMLLAGSINPNGHSTHGRYFLHTACSIGNKKIIFLLIKAGAQLDIIDSTGNTALHYACLHGDVRIVTGLINAGANISVKNYDKKMALELIPKPQTESSDSD
jgi:ankyrin repeat protein